MTAALASTLSSSALHGLNMRQDRVDDPLVAGAPADIADESLLHLIPGRVWMGRDEARQRHRHARKAHAALHDVVLLERLLQRRQFAADAQPLDGSNVSASRRHDRQEAR